MFGIFLSTKNVFKFDITSIYTGVADYFDFNSSLFDQFGVNYKLRHHSGISFKRHKRCSRVQKFIDVSVSFSCQFICASLIHMMPVLLFFDL